MNKALDTGCASLFGIGAFIAISVIGIVIVGQSSNLFAWIACILIILLAGYIGYVVFNYTKIVGPMAMITAAHGSPDMDNLIPSNSDNQKMLDFDQINESQEILNPMIGNSFVHIYGDTNNLTNRDTLQIEGFNINSQKDELEISLENKVTITVSSPQSILIGKSVLKIFKANSVRITNKDNQSLTYKKIDNKIVVDQERINLNLLAFPKSAALTIVRV